MISVPWLNETDLEFPDPSSALAVPNGLLAAGGDLSPERIIQAYTRGIFPWFEEGQPILWWTPNPRMVLFPKELHVGKSLKKAIRKSDFIVTSDEAFREVIMACSGKRPYSSDTWITPGMIETYCTLHEMGVAHSVEVWAGSELVGGLYGLAMDRVFFGESMFSTRDYASKIAFVYLVRKLEKLGYRLIDCQVASSYLASFGAREISREEFMTYLPTDADYCRNSAHWPLQ